MYHVGCILCLRKTLHLSYPVYEFIEMTGSTFIWDGNAEQLTDI